MLKCLKCGKSVSEKEALIHKNTNGEKEIICPDCFKTATGVDYKTFSYRKESAKQTLFAIIFCLAATVYAFVEKGPLYGVLGIVLTILIYLFASKIK
ncbi:MAG: hypothetical protein WCS30_06855 [Selenomonadaceae bacterium]|jgi:hypothetical protein